MDNVLDASLNAGPIPTPPPIAAVVGKATAEQGEWCGANAAAAGKEDFALLKTLQGNPASVPAQALLQLSLLTGVAKETAEELIYQIRTNAASLDRGGKAGCALCCHMGYTNHDCEPNTAAAIDAQGYVRLTALRAMAPGDEVLISYDLLCYAEAE